MIETAILEKNEKKNRTTIVAVETTTKEITTDNWKLSETAPKCNDCVATIVTCNIRPEDTYRRKIKLSSKTTG